MFVWALKNWKLIALAVGLLSAIAGLFWVHHAGYNKGYAKATAEYEAAKISAQKKAQKKIFGNIELNDKNAKENVYNAHDTCMSRVGSAVDSMSEPSNNR